MIGENISVEEAVKSAGLVFMQGEFELPTGPIEEVRIAVKFDK